MVSEWEIDMQPVIHEIEPIYNAKSRVLVLGTFPSIKSREGGFFYHHPQNRFWKVLAGMLEKTLPSTIEEKKAFLLENQIAVWDVVKSCEISGSSDSSIRNVVPNDLNGILSYAPIDRIVTNGNKAHDLYVKYCMYLTGRMDLKLPSTSPANAAFDLEKLIRCWEPLKEALCQTSIKFDET